MSLLFLDPDRKRELGYRDAKSKVYIGGREVLKGGDWKRRVRELAERSGGICENHFRWRGDAIQRCRNEADHAHHIVLRSVLRDDRLKALMHVCEWCHRFIDSHQRLAHRKEKTCHDNRA